MGGRSGSEKRVSWRPRAKLDLIECAVYLGDNAGPERAERFLAAVEDTLSRVLHTPEMASLRTFDNPRLAGMRQWAVKGFSSYLLLYLPTEDGFELVRVLHAARDRDRILKEERAAHRAVSKLQQR
jgi:toxin ParE1/3/4